MTDGFKVQVTGLRAFQADLRKMDAGLSKELSKQFRVIAERVASKASGRVPRLTGAAARSVKAHGTLKGASVTAGGSGVPYYPWLDYGGKVGRNKSIVRPFIKTGRYVYPAAAEEVQATEEAAKDAIRDAASKAGFGVEG